MTRRLFTLAILALAALVSGCPEAVVTQVTGTKASEAEVKQNMHAIQLALERYAVDTGGRYPLDIEELRAIYLPNMPDNPLGQGQMQPVEPSASAPGMFSYVVVEAEDANGLRFAREYALIGYGTRQSQPLEPPSWTQQFPGLTDVDWDSVVIVLGGPISP